MGRIDCFSEISTKLYGEKLKEQVEDRLKFYESGDLPKKNVDAMQEAIAAVKEEASTFEEVKKKKKDKKSKKRKAEEMEDEKENEIKQENGAIANGDAEIQNAPVQDTTSEQPKKKKMKMEKDSEAQPTQASVPVPEVVTESGDGEQP